MSGEALGRRLLRFDAAYCLAGGAIAVTLASPLARLLETRPAVLAVAGLGALAWALVLRRLASIPSWRRAVAAVAAANLVGAIGLAALALGSPASAARLLLAAVAIEVAAFATGQLAVLGR